MEKCILPVCNLHTSAKAALLNRLAAKLLQVGREMFQDNLNIFEKSYG